MCPQTDIKVMPILHTLHIVAEHINDQIAFAEPFIRIFMYMLKTDNHIPDSFTNLNPYSKQKYISGKNYLQCYISRLVFHKRMNMFLCIS